MSVEGKQLIRRKEQFKAGSGTLGDISASSATK
jgi:hypothetical protein